MPYDAFSTSDADLVKLIDDTMEICLHWRIGQWSCPWPDLVKSLRHHRWAFYRPRRQWSIQESRKDELRERLVRQGFIYQDGWLIMTKDIKKPSTSSRKPARAAAQGVLDVNPDIDQEELIEMLRDCTDPQQKKKIRAKLRSIGHKGGLRK